jgi:hypothetical protein
MKGIFFPEVGEVSGTVTLNESGLGRIIVNIYNISNALVSRVITESDGYFSYIGLVPGKYKAQVDQAQLLKLHMTSSPFSTTFTIKSSKEGDVVEGLKFILYKKDVTEHLNDQPEMPD